MRAHPRFSVDTLVVVERSAMRGIRVDHASFLLQQQPVATGQVYTLDNDLPMYK